MSFIKDKWALNEVLITLNDTDTHIDKTTDNAVLCYISADNKLIKSILVTES